jgi:macrolide-specific efflux system membrane fusion protein
MSARADIVVGTRSDALLLPITAIFERQGQLVAHVVRPYGIEARPVDVGESSEALVEIVSGLTEGDQVMLTDPGHAVVAAPPGGRIPAVDRAQRSQSGGTKAIQPR